MSEDRIAKLEREQARQDQRIHNLEKEQERHGQAIGVLDQRTDEMGKFAVKIDLVVEQLDKTTKNIEKTLTNYITKQETKEEEQRKAELQGKEQEITKWQSWTMNLGKWILFILVAGASGKGIWEIIQELVGLGK